ERVGADDDFFALGGNSLIATQVVSRLGVVLDSRVAVRVLFEAPTVAGLAARVESHAGEGARAALVARERPERIPLSLAQQRMWFLNRFEPESAAYNIPIAIRLSGELDVAALSSAIADVVARHESLRTIYPEHDGAAEQVILSATQAVPDLTVHAVAESELPQRITEAVSRPLDVSTATPLAVTLFELGATEHVVVMVVHHISADAFSMGPLARDVMVAYAARADGDEPRWSPLPVQYADYSTWQRELLGSESDASSLIAGQIDYWTTTLAGLPDELSLPMDRPRPATQSLDGGRVPFQIDAGTYRGLVELARANNATVFMVVHGALAAFLARMSVSDDIAIGTPIAGRGEAALDDMIGMFVNTLVLRSRIDTSESFVDLLDRIRRTDVDAFGHADVPFERLVDLLHPERSTARHPLFQVALAFQNVPTTDFTLPGVTARGVDIDVHTAKFDLTLTVLAAAPETATGGVAAEFSYATSLFDRATIEHFADRFGQLLRTVAATPNVAVGDIELLSVAERADLTSRTGPDAEAAQTLPQLLATATKIDPDAPALVADGVVLSYDELDIRSNRLARMLIGRGVGPEDLVAVAVPRSIESVIAVWAVAKSGAAFVPVDPSYPPDRIAHMLSDSGAVMGLTVPDAREALPDSVEWLSTDDVVGSSRENVPDVVRLRTLSVQHPAYVIYTSGSTGKPKGVTVTHAGLANFAAEQRERFAVTSSSRVLHFASPSFDASILELLLAVCAGAATVIAPTTVYGGTELADLIRRQRITHAFVTPAALASVDPIDLDDLQVVVAGGDAVPAGLVSRWATTDSTRTRRFFNAYGPTEATVAPHISEPLTAGDLVTIGKPIRGMRSVVLDQRLRPVPVGVAGELYVSGVQLARGYHERNGLTADRFVADPYGVAGERMYRTGDVVRWTITGDVEYVGRSDFQVKVRGFRVELGEIDAVLTDHVSVRFATTIGHTNAAGATSLVSYVVAAQGQSISTSQLIEHAATRLPSHMVPASVMVLGDIPLTRAGKLDRAALPEPVYADAVAFTAPRTPVEETIAAVFAEVLGVERVGVDDSFFALGGDSIVSIQLVSRAKARGVVFSPRNVFEQRTVAGLAAIAATAKAAAPVVLEELRGGGVGDMPLPPVVRFMAERGGSYDRFNQTITIELPMEIDRAGVVNTLTAVVDRHDMLRSRLFTDDDGLHLDVLPVGAIDVDALVSHVPFDAGLDAESLTNLATRELDSALSRLDPASGVVVQFVWLNPIATDKALRRSGRLIVAAHHLAVDGVSWRILLPDFVSAWAQISAGRVPLLAEPSTSMRRWSTALTELVADRAAELPMWQEIIDGPDPLLGTRALDPAVDVATTVRNVRLELSAETTADLLTTVPELFHGGATDAMLTALALALTSWRRRRGVSEASSLIRLEGHGREEEVVPGADLSRTVGWFTAIFPVRLDLGGIDVDDALAGGPAMGSAIKAVKEQILALPDKGIGYGMLRYLDPASSLPTEMPGQVSFNYLGQVSTTDIPEELAGFGWMPADDLGELEVIPDADMPAMAVIDINAIVLQGKLVANLGYPETLLERGDVDQFATRWTDALAAVVAHAKTAGAGGRTPSDLFAAGVPQSDIDTWEAHYPALVDAWPLSPLQSGLLFHANLAAESVDVYTSQIVLSLNGSVDSERLRAAADGMIARHAALRTAFVRGESGSAVQVVLDATRAPWRDVDLTSNPDADRADECAAIVADDRAARFDLTDPPLIRFTLVRIDSDAWKLVVTNHHIILDGWSMPLVLQELLTLYVVRNDRTAIPAALSYRSYLEWIALQDTDASLAEWRAALDGVVEPTLLAPAEPGRVVTALAGELIFELDEARTARLSVLAARVGVTVNTVLQAGWGVLLSRLVGVDDVVFGTTVSGRPAGLSGVESMVGLFINTVPVRVRVDPAESVEELLTRVQGEQADLLDHHYVGLADIQAAAGVSGLFDTLVVFESYPVDAAGIASQAASIDGMSITGIDAADATHYPLSLIVSLAATLSVRAGFLRDLLDEESVRLIADRLIRVLSAMIAAPDAAVGDIELLDVAERSLVLSGFNDTAQVVDSSATLVSLFEAQASATPGAVAVSFEGEQLTYGEFASRVHRLARWLIAEGVGPESLVALGMRRSLDLVVGMYAVSVAGGGYVPLDPDHPAERIDYILETAQPVAVLTTSGYEFESSARTVAIDTLNLEAFSDAPIADGERTSTLDSSNTAYVIFTSGSTGRPKGVAVSHGAIVNRLVWMQSAYPLTESDVVLQKTPATFDVSVWEFFWPLQTGARLVVARPDGHRDPAYLVDIIRSENVTTAHFVPSMLAVFVAAGASGATGDVTAGVRECTSLRQVFASGEALPGKTAQQLRAATGARLHNLYGPTEAAVDVTFHEVVDADIASVSIGAPVFNTELFVLDGRLRPVPVGVAGELYLAGVQLARGYVGRPDLTSDRFVANPYGEPGARMYRTGDLVSWNSRGELNYIGRTDFQVKLRGLRIELGEIETALVQQDSINEAVAVVRQDTRRGDQLVAYLVAEVDKSIVVARVREGLGKRLPSYMVPTAFVVLDALPLNASGKLDRKALPEPSFGPRKHRPPTTDAERAVAAVFSGVLGVDRVGTTDDFFELGGNSLLATQVVARLGAALDTEIGVRVVFEASTVAALATRAQSLAGGGARTPLVPQPRPDRVPLSLAQQRMWFLNRFEPDSAAYNVPMAIRMVGVFDADVFAAAAADVLARHESLRTVYPETVDGPVQVIEVASRPDLTPEQVAEEDLSARIFELVAAPFDVTADVPVRMNLLRISPADHVLAVVVHHIVADGYSMGPLAQDLMTAYRARATDESPSWSPLPVQYADFALWQRAVLGSEDDPNSVTSRQLAYWRTTLAGLPDQIDLPTDRPRPAVQSFAGATTSFTIDADMHNRLNQLANEQHSTLFMILHAALAVLLARLSSAEDIAIGTPVAGRGEEALDGLVGMFVNTLVLRTRIDNATPFTDLLATVREGDLEAFANADVPFERLVEVLNPTRSTARHPLFQVSLTLQNMERADFALPGLVVTGLNADTHIAQFDVQLAIAERRDERGSSAGIDAQFTYATDLFDETTVVEFGNRLTALLSGIVTDPSTAVGDIDLLAAAERERIVSEWNATDHSVPNMTLAELTAVGMQRDPGAVAVSFDGAELTFAEFDGRVNRLARRLIADGVGPESLVTVAMRRSLDLVVSLHAVVAAGGAFVPVDPDHPIERIGYILETAAPVCVLTSSADGFVTTGTTPTLAVDIIDLDDLAADPIAPEERSAHLAAGNTAYVIFTSGSTGRPKGVAVTHAAIVNQMLWMVDRYGVDSTDVYFQKTATTFDVSLWGYFLPLITGARLVVATPDGHRDAAYVSAAIAEHHVTITDFVPSMLTVFTSPATAQQCDTLRHVFVIGEALPIETARAFRALATAGLHNLYGPTEAAVSVTSWQSSESDTGSVPIGVPEWNVAAYVLDARLRPVPVGVAGELYLAGRQLARGYVSRPDLTADRFVANPFGSGRLYRTGDLVRWTNQGVLDYIGRTDFQVKFRGQRIELGEIETALLADDTVSQAVALVTETVTGQQLVAYVVPAAAKTVDIVSLKSTVGDRLPSYMLPSAIVVLDELPLNSSGKLDRKALPDPVFEAKTFRTPSTPIEEIVAGIFAEVLGIERVGADDDFFALGGNSLIATQMVSRLAAALDTTVAVRTLFEAPTVYALAARVELHAGQGNRVVLRKRARPEQIPLSLAQQRMWFLNRYEPGSSAYNIPIAIRLTGALDVAALRHAIADVVDRHEALRTVYPERDGVAVQFVVPAADVVATLALAPQPIDRGRLSDRVNAIAATPFDVAAQVPLSIGLLELSGTEHVLVVVIHHISGDAFSMGPLSRDIMVAYAARSQGDAPAWAPLAVQYADYSQWQHEVLGSESDPTSVVSQQVDYWTTALAALPAETNLPTDAPRPAAQSYRGGRVDFAIPDAVARAVDATARVHGATPFMMLHTALAVLLAQVAGSDDVAIGTPIAGRGDAALDHLVGMFVNTLVLRTVMDPRSSIAALIDQVSATDIDAFGHADLPFERLVDIISPERSASRHPLFQVALVFQDADGISLELGDLQAGALEIDTQIAKFDLQFGFTRTAGGLAASITYASDLFERTTVERFGRQLVRVLEQITADTTRPAGDIDLLDAAERADLLGRTGGAAEPAQTLPELIAAATALDPDATALTYRGSEVSYGELDSTSSQLARVLIDRGVGPETAVAIGISRSVESVVALWAVTKAGGVAVPVDLKFPRERIAHMLADSGAVLLLTNQSDAIDYDIAVLAIGDELDIELASKSADVVTDADRVATLGAADTAYLIYTSGSTGTPKGVSVTHAGLANFAAEQRDRYSVTAHSRVLHFASPSFDASFMEYLMGLCAGATLVIAPADIYGGDELAALLERERVTHAFVTTAALASIGSADLPELRVLVTGGEALPAEVAARWIADGRDFYNGYGPTETTIVSNLGAPLRAGERVTLGGPIRGMRSLILDRQLRPVPVGVAGEHYLAGIALARGYHRRPTLTAERFVADPYGAVSDRMYRTGDVVRWTDAGRIEYIGRADFQVKMRGFRIELGEIDSALTAHPGVEFAITIAHTRDGAMSLASYVSPMRDQALVPDDLTAFVADTLPSHMVPASITVLDALPLTPAGKVDRRALPAPVFQSSTEFRAPETPNEIAIAAVFGDVLGVATVGAHDSFFDLGGNSLSATRATSRVTAALGVSVAVRDLFEAPTVAELAVRTATFECSARLPLVPQTRPARIPLSMAQQRMWILNQLDPSSAAYNVALAMRLTGDLDVDALDSAIRDVVERHEALRTRYPEFDGVPAQVIEPVDRVVGRLTATPAAMADIADVTGAGFDATTEVPVRIRLFRTGATEYVLAVVVHHIAADGFSLGPLGQEVMAAYTSRSAGSAPTWAPLPVQYADFAIWQRETLGSADDPDSLMAQQIAYWSAQLAELPDLLRLPTDRTRPAVASMRGGRYDFTIDAALQRRLAALADANDASMFMVVHTALAVLLSRLSGTGDIAIGTPVAGRGDVALDRLIGMFVNTLVLRTRVDGGQSFAAVLDQVRENDLSAFSNSDMPFERLVEVLDPVRSTAYSTLFQVMLTFQNFERTEFVLPGLTVEPIESAAAHARFDLTVTMAELDAGIRVELTYATDLFDHDSMRQLSQRYLLVLEAMVTALDTSVGDVDLMDDDERHRLAYRNRTERAGNDGATLVSEFERQVAATPSGIALVFGEQQLTYSELAARVNALARRLIADGVGAESTVAIAMRRSIDLLVAMYAVTTSGAAYVPVDIDHPAERTQHLLDSARPMCILTTSMDASQLHTTLPTVAVDTLDLSNESTAPVTDSDRRRSLNPDNPAYVLFTSGSTGLPKGVVVSHRAIVNQLAWKHSEYGLDADDVFLLKTPATFDASMRELWLPLQVGARIVIAAPGGERDVDYLADTIEQHGVTATHFVASMLALLIAGADAAKLRSLRTVFVGGEPLPTTTAAKFLAVSNALLTNEYGPTEAAVTATNHPVTAADIDVMPIGVPVQNVVVYALDDRLRPVPDGVAGELYLGGTQLARGYFGRPDLTSERFVADPLRPGLRMYRTGDRVRWNRADDKPELEYLGRTDFQVHVRGLRIELGEIESALLDQPTVDNAVATVQVDTNGQQELVGYFVPSAGTSIDVGDLRAAIARRVPSYMVPGSLVELDAFPLNANGKLDRNALPRPERVVPTAVAPTSENARLVADVFADVLDLDQVGSKDSFFELGGNSLIGMTVVSRLRAASGIEVQYNWLFAASTPEELGLLLSGGGARAGASAFDVLTPLRSSGDREPLFCIHPAGGLAWFYAGLISHLDDDRPLFGLQDPRVVKGEQAYLAIEDYAARYVDEIRRVQPHGPYHLLGWSLGGRIAHAMAVQLQAEGDRVALLAMMDAAAELTLPDEPPATGQATSVSDAVGDTLGGWRELLDLADDAQVSGPEELAELIRDRISAAGMLTAEQVDAMIESFTEADQRTYRPGVFVGDLMFFTAARDHTGDDVPSHTWRRYVSGDIEDTRVDERHLGMANPAALDVIGPMLRDNLRS
ncbi:non-ribosomal peptide synthase/polyketide synthase, partial [Antrihabitans cavernicola]